MPKDKRKKKREKSNKSKQESNNGDTGSDEHLIFSGELQIEIGFGLRLGFRDLMFDVWEVIYGCQI